MKYRSSLRVAAAAAFCTMILSAPAALAADIDPPPAPEMRSSVYDWSGAYVGGVITGVFVDSNYLPIGGTDPNLDGDGTIGGILAGYNYQMGNFVLGIEGDAQFGEVDPNNIIDQVTQEIDFMATLRARLGYAHDRTLAYVTGGVAFMDSEITLPAFAESDSQSHTGYTFGGGLEHAWTDSLLARVEYLYANFNTKDYTYTPGTVRYYADDFHMFRFAGAWKF